MHFFRLIFASSCCFSLSLCQPRQLDQGCKPLPGDASWPSNDAWNKLNSSVSGRLAATVPAGAVCHPQWPQYNNQSCNLLLQQWTNSSYHALNPVSSDYNDDTCLPSPMAPCSASGYPSYAVEAAEAKDIQAAVNFARQTAVRLVVKATGHDYPGRSSGAGSFSIHTRGLRGLVLNRNDSRATSLGGIASLKISAGERMTDINRYAAAQNITVIGGADPGVGIGGWILAGGHSPLSSRYGLGADQILEMEVVTADGALRTLNEKSNPDLFWALRGGGGGTFAVMTSVTVKVYPQIAIAERLFAYNTTANSDSLWSMVTYFHTQIPHLSNAGVMGYYYITPEDSTETNSSMRGKLFGQLLAPGMSAAKLQSILQPMEDTLSSYNQSDKIFVTGVDINHPDFSSWRTTAMPEKVGNDGRLGSRLLGQDSLSSNNSKLNGALRESTPSSATLIGHMVAGPGVRSPPGGVVGGENSVLPAWRSAYAHVALLAQWPQLNSSAKSAVTTNLREKRVEALRSIAPESGAYRNEADPTEPDWQRTFHGKNYDKLLTVKQKWDPAGVFWCKACVGSELWNVTGSDGIENGVGQSQVRLCRAVS